jgi:pimeloyl-ACP methyl ester carboxylesterase
MRLFFGPLLLLLVLSAACSSEDGQSNDSGVPTDAVDDYDGGVAPDARPDAGRIDGGKRDVGFDDPATIIRGQEIIAGVDTFVEVQGVLTSTSPPIFLLHTGPNLSHEYLPEHMRFLLDGNRLLVYWDLRGTGLTAYGDTSGTSTVTAEQHVLDVEDLRLFMGERGANVDKIDLVAHGYGAGIASLYAAANPDRVDHLVLTTPFPTNIRQLGWFRADADARLTSTDRQALNLIMSDPQCWGDFSGCEIMSWLVRGPHYMCPENRSKFRELFFEHGSPETLHFVERDLRNTRYDWSTRLASVTAKTTIIAGACDPTRPETVLTYSSTITGSVLQTLEHSGHFPMVEEPEEYRRLVKEALRR